MKTRIFNQLNDLLLIEEIEKLGTFLSFKTGETIVKNEKYIKVIPLLLNGTVKVLRVDDNGNELFLYHILGGQSCAVSLASCLNNKPSNIKAIAEEDSELIAIPISVAMEWYKKYPSWQLFVLETVNNRFDELITTIDSIAFTNTDKRLIHFLLARTTALQTQTLHITHQEIANELSTSREIISRLLKQLERQGKLELSRNKIEIISAL